jgi:hypothetical protein
MTSQSLVGKVGSVVRAVRGGSLPGEVRLVIAGLPHIYIAYCGDPLAVGTEVLVINNRGARAIDVEPWQLSPGIEGVHGATEGQ